MYVSDLKMALEIFGPKLTQIYGQGEIAHDHQLCLASGCSVSASIRATSKSRLLRRAAHRRRHAWSSMPTVAQLPAGEIGEVITRSDCVMSGYWNNSGGQRQGAARRLALDGRHGVHRQPKVSSR